MKIIDMKCNPVDIPFSKPFYRTPDKLALNYRGYIIEIITDEGIIGIGESSFYTGVKNWLKYLETVVKPFLLKEIVDPCLVEKFAATFRAKQPGACESPRPSCVEMALWDIIGKKANLPVYKILGGGQSRVKAYASVIHVNLYKIEEWLALVRQLQGVGFKAMKLHIGETGENAEQYTVDVIRAIREDIGYELELMIDAGQAWRPYPKYTYRSAVKLGRELEKYDVIWLEEPLPHHDNPELGARLCDALDIEIAGGGGMFGWPSYWNLIERGALDIVQPDVSISGGISELRKIAFIAEIFGRQCVPHFSWGSDVAFAATLHVCSLINSPYIEYMYHPPYITEASRTILSENPIKMDEDGYVEIPQGPGLGVALKENWKDHVVEE